VRVPKHILPIIVFSQFAGTSLWFSGNAILPQIKTSWNLPQDSIAQVTSAVMLGFILGTLLFALLSVADRFKATGVFLLCTILGAFFNSSIFLFEGTYAVLLIARFLTGITLAGIYPVGMKIASDWYKGNLGKALGYLVGALVLGSAFPHLLNYTGSNYRYEFVLLGTSVLAIIGGLAMFFGVGEGPYRTKASAFRPRQAFQVFSNKDFRSAALGYFGHMWELYAFWAFVPVVLVYYNDLNGTHLNPSLWTFLIMGIGFFSCAVGGIGALKFGSAKVAYAFLLVSGLMCLVSPFIFDFSPALFLALLLLWGFAVIGDSAQFSTLNAQTAPPEYRGTALTIAVSIGFFITIPSIQLLGYLNQILDTKWILLFLSIGPMMGLYATRRLLIKL